MKDCRDIVRAVYSPLYEINISFIVKSKEKFTINGANGVGIMLHR